MSDSFFCKDPSRLPCPHCRNEVDTGMTFGALIHRWKQQLSCPHCHTAIRVEGRTYHSWLPIPLVQGLDLLCELPGNWSPWLTLCALLLSFYLLGKEIAATHLVLHDVESKPAAEV